MSNAQWEYENQDFLRARYEDKKWYTVRKHICLECGKEYYTICNFRKYCSDACCKSAEQKRTEERKSVSASLGAYLQGLRKELFLQAYRRAVLLEQMQTEILPHRKEVIAYRHIPS